MKIVKITIIFALVLSSYWSMNAKAQLTMPYLFSDNMVVQRNEKWSVWGESSPNDTITIYFNQQKAITVSDSHGHWKTKLAEEMAGGPYNLILRASSNKQEVRIENVLVGDVWLASGQSNMEWQVQQAMNADEEIKNANYAEIRFFNVPHAKELKPQTDTKGGCWEVCDSLSVKDKSAVAYYFSRKIHKDIGVPIGIIQSSWGGTPVEAWTSKEQLLTSPIGAPKAKESETITLKDFEKDSIDLIRFWDIVYNPDTALVSEISDFSYNDNGWSTLQMPSIMKNWDMDGYEGMVWLRKHFIVGNKSIDNSWHLYLGHPEMNYSVYINGVEICKNMWNANKTHDYTIPDNVIHTGENVITVRMAALWGGGGFNPPADSMYLSNGSEKISMAGDWLLKEDLEPQIPKIVYYQTSPTFLFNGMINPLIPYAVKGFIWYQGENNVDEATDYATLFPLMIKDWRQRWGMDELPFIFVQLANYMKEKPEPAESNWALLRESQTKTLSMPNTGMACIIDLGEADNIHPKNKQEVGRRLALIAEKQVYEKNVSANGPMLDNYEIKGNKVIVEFKNTSGQLMLSKGNELLGFALAGKDKKYYWAKAKIKADKVIITSSNVKNPVAVRYAWADNPHCNLVNAEGLPAVPFRTDSWDAAEKP